MQNVLLLGSMMKVKQTARSVQLLAGNGCVEEVQAMSRVLVEVIVNAAYLQRAGFAELQSFVNFHPRTLYTQIALLGDGRNGAQPGMLERLRGLIAQKPAQRTREEGDPTWSARNLMERAEASDATSGVPVMRLLMERVYPFGHAATHGTIESLEPFLAELDRSGRQSKPDRQAAQVEAIFAVNLCLFTLCLYLNQVFGLRMDRAIDDAAKANHSFASVRGELAN